MAATAFIDAGHPVVRAFAARAVAGAEMDPERTSGLFPAVRDEIRSDPYQLSDDPDGYLRSSGTDRDVRTAVR